jgi:nucleotide sugar dehydrogenase
MMRVAIVGHGFVGKAVDEGLKGVEKMIIDPNYGTGIEDLQQFMPDLVFVSVPTPMNKDGSIDSSILEDVVFKISATSTMHPIIVIKSTCTPTVIDRLAFVCKFVYNPEFLTERNAYQDFINPSAIILGVSGDNEEDLHVLEDFYRNNTKCNQYAPIVKTTAHTAAFIKYATNTFLANKVIFFNQLKELYDTAGEKDWDTLTKTLSYDKRMGGSHMQVPGPDGRLGFGGACFPKDVAAFLKYGESLGKDLTVLRESAHYNAELRGKYNRLDDRELAQNVNFNYDKKN